MESHSVEAKKTDKNLTRISYLVEGKKENTCIPLASFKILNKYSSQLNRFSRVGLNEINSETMCGTRSSCRVLSAESIMKIARKRFLVHLASQKTENFSESGDSYENQRGGELVLRLLVAAEKFCNEQFDRSEQFLVGCYLVP
ncbi:DELLA protein GAI-like [Forsythia ovata]|uniref:DELLA protein GAI-like n=1 Tax=Forsythia ovata TaxID=205694 RepID=A0ABD1P606_9LAMI